MLLPPRRATEPAPWRSTLSNDRERAMCHFAQRQRREQCARFRRQAAAVADLSGWRAGSDEWFEIEQDEFGRLELEHEEALLAGPWNPGRYLNAPARELAEVICAIIAMFARLSARHADVPDASVDIVVPDELDLVAIVIEAPAAPPRPGADLLAA